MFWRLDNPPTEKAGYRASILKEMQMCKSYIPTVKATAWKFQNFHKLLHVVDNIKHFGAPMKYCAQSPESLLIPVQKTGRCAETRQQRGVHKLQAAQRLSCSIIVDTVYSCL
jgi:hypothetical protein